MSMEENRKKEVSAFKKICRSCGALCNAKVKKCQECSYDMSEDAKKSRELELQKAVETGKSMKQNKNPGKVHKIAMNQLAKYHGLNYSAVTLYVTAGLEKPRGGLLSYPGDSITHNLMEGEVGKTMKELFFRNIVQKRKEGRSSKTDLASTQVGEGNVEQNMMEASTSKTEVDQGNVEHNIMKGCSSKTDLASTQVAEGNVEQNMMEASTSKTEVDERNVEMKASTRKTEEIDEGIHENKIGEAKPKRKVKQKIEDNKAKPKRKVKQKIEDNKEKPKKKVKQKIEDNKERRKSEVKNETEDDKVTEVWLCGSCGKPWHLAKKNTIWLECPRCKKWRHTKCHKEHSCGWTSGRDCSVKKPTYGTKSKII